MVDQKQFETSLKSGEKVRLRWRGCAGMATIVRVNRSSIAVMTDEPIGPLPRGERVLVNKTVSGRWSASKCVRPLESTK